MARAVLRLFLAALSAGLVAVSSAPGGDAQSALPDVDLALVLAVDASGSLSDDRWELERQGYADAFRDPAVIKAITSGAIGAIAVTLVEWSGQFQQMQVVPWTTVTDAASAAAFANRLARIPHLFRSWTSISEGMSYSAHVLSIAPYSALRKVIDVSGDGPDSTSQLSIRGTLTDTQRLVNVRDAVVKQGLVVNGLPIFGDPQIAGFPLDTFYATNVIGGPGAFMVVAQDFNSFADAVRRKLILEIARLPTQGGIELAAFGAE